MPLPIYKLVSDNRGIREINMDLVQGRWQENVMKRITSFSNRQFKLPEFAYAEPGLAIKIKSDEKQEA
jgi:hypothetical protein